MIFLRIHIDHIIFTFALSTRFLLNVGESELLNGIEYADPRGHLIHDHLHVVSPPQIIIDALDIRIEALVCHCCCVTL